MVFTVAIGIASKIYPLAIPLLLFYATWIVRIMVALAGVVAV